jgi:hypothetical protein
MGKADQEQTQKRTQKATSCKSKHKPNDGESKHKKQPSFDATKFEAPDHEGSLHCKWRDQFRQLCEFKVQFGHCFVSKGYSANPKLGVWVATQRRNYKLHPDGVSSRMPAERIRALDGIGFEWEVSKAAVVSAWNARFQQLSEFKVQFGHCHVTKGYFANPKLGVWVATQRHSYKSHPDGKPSRMPAERIRALNGIGFDWTRNASLQVSRSIKEKTVRRIA